MHLGHLDLVVLDQFHLTGPRCHGFVERGVAFIIVGIGFLAANVMLMRRRRMA